MEYAKNTFASNILDGIMNDDMYNLVTQMFLFDNVLL